MSLLPVAEAQARMLALAAPLPVERVDLMSAVGRHAAEDVVAKRTQPAADLSAMDGYAIRFAERPGPWTVVGESAAGGGLDRALAPGEAARIFTGAPVPEGADVILIQEEAGRDGERLTMTGEGPPAIGTWIRRRGGDFVEGEVLLRQGTKLGPAAIALAVSGGHGDLLVRCRPRIALLSTGNELVEPGVPTFGAMLPASNGPMLGAMFAGMPCEIGDYGIVRDDLDLISATFAAMADTADVIVTTGGASVGDHDLVLPALEKVGAKIDFWRVAMRPGKPVMIGTLAKKTGGSVVVLGLPGNPVSAFVTATLFLKPLVAHLLGSLDPIAQPQAARLGAAIGATGNRADFLRATWRDGAVWPVANQDSAALAALAQADVLILRDVGAPPAEAGETVAILPIA